MNMQRVIAFVALCGACLAGCMAETAAEPSVHGSSALGSASQAVSPEVQVDLIKNGGFASGLANWSTYINNNVAPGTAIDAQNGLANATIYYDGRPDGYPAWYVQLFQGGLLVQQGKTYTLSFDASGCSHGPGAIFDVVVEHNGSPYTEYLPTKRVEVPAITCDQLHHYTYTFTSPATDANARVALNMGVDTQWQINTIHIDNVSLTTTVAPLTAEIRVRDRWSTGYCADVLVTNNGPSPQTWQSITFGVGSSSIFTHWYQTTLSGSTGIVTMTNPGSGIVIPAGATNSSNGFCANNFNGAPDPAVISVDAEPQQEQPLTAALRVRDRWSTGYCVDIVVTNNDSVPWLWESITFDVGSANIFTHWYQTTLTGSTGVVTMTNPGTGIVVPPGATNSSNGFCANNFNGAPDPAVISVNAEAQEAITCGSASCDLGGNYCCAAAGTFTCQATACASTQINVVCNADETGCATGQHCRLLELVASGASTFCSTDGSLGGCSGGGCSLLICETSADCPAGSQCGTNPGIKTCF